MRKIASILLLLVSLCVSAQPQGKWFGYANLSGGTSFHKDDMDSKYSNTSGDIELKGGYRTDKYFISALLGAGSSYHMQSRSGFGYSITGAEGEEDINLNMDLTDIIATSASYKAVLEGGFDPDKWNTIRLKFSHNIRSEERGNGIFSFDPTKENFELQYSTDDGITHKWDSHFDASWQHRFIDGKKFDFNTNWMYAHDSRTTEWIIGMLKEEEVDLDDDEIEDRAEKFYRITPLYIDQGVSAKAALFLPDVSGNKGLDITLGMLLKFARDIDEYSAANRKNRVWVDSLSYHETFDYLTMTLEPSVNIKYNSGPFNVNVTLAPQFYSDRLNSGEKTERLDAGTLTQLADIGLTWAPSKTHRVSFNANRSIRRPDYLQMCWFRRPGAYLNEYQQGNPGLDPTKSTRISLSYGLKVKRFGADFEVGHTRETDRIERTFNYEKIDKLNFRVYTWINAGSAQTSNAKLTLKWSGKSLSASLGGNVNYYRGVTDSGNVSESSDYSLNANVNYTWKYGFWAEARARYQSKIIRSYTSITEYVGCDLKIAKKLWKRFDVYIEGRDLADSPIQIETCSEDFRDARIEINNYNRRKFLLGVRYEF